MVGHLADVITYAKFQDDIFRGYNFIGGRISHFPIDFCLGLTTVQRDCAACDPSKFGMQIDCGLPKQIPSLNLIPEVVFRLYCRHIVKSICRRPSSDYSEIWQADAKYHVDNYTFVKIETGVQYGGRLFSETGSSFYINRGL